jgi:hypothetical protein
MPPSSPPRRQRLITAASRCLCALVLALWTVPLAAAREPLDGSQQPLVRIPGAVARATDGAIAIRAGDRELVYVEGFGWLGDVSAPEPQLRDGEVYGTPALLAALGLDVATLEAVRFAGDTEVRVVLDVPALDEASLRHLTRSGEVAPGEGVRLNLPPLLLPAGLLQTYGGLEVLLEQDLDGVIVEIVGGAFRYEVFTVPGPTRVVLDLKLERPPLEPDTSQVLAEGIVYRRLQAEGSGGLSRVHVIDVAPGVGEWRVVGTPGEVRTTDRWADGGFAAINGGYFDTSTRQVIGMLVVDGVLYSLPSRGRAVVAFGDGPPIIDRVKASYSVWLDDVPVAVRGAPFVDEVNVVTGPGYAGSARYGVLVVDELDGEVLDNRVGPVRLRTDQYAVVYPAELRALALAEPGTRVRYTWHFTPEAFGSARYALEAGPLLLKDGRNVLAPELEMFAVGQRILDGLTQQAALGVRPDGSVVLVAAESMVAADLVPLLQRLGVSDALRLDSGGSTTLYANGKVINRRSERAVVNAIVLRLP